MRRAIILAVAAAALSLAACGSDGGSDADLEDVDVVELLEQAASRMEGVESFHIELEHQNGTATIVRGLSMVRAEGDVQALDQMHLAVEVSVGPLNADIEIIVLPTESWITNPLTGRWEREDIDVSEFFDPQEGITAVMRLVQNPELAGAEQIEGVDTYRVEADVASESLTLFGNPRAGETLRVRAWIGVDDPLVYRIEAVGGIVEGEPDNLVRELTLSEFGADFDIQAPR